MSIENNYTMVFIRSNHNVICTVNGKWIASDNDYIRISKLVICESYIVNRVQGLVVIYLKFAQVSAYQLDLLCALLIKLAGGFYVRVFLQ